LNRYTEQGYLSYDNDAAERAVKYPAIGRKNYLFVGNVRAGKHAGYFYSLVNSAKSNGVEPFAWLRDLMEKLPAYRQSEAFSQASRGEPVTSNELDELLPDRWLVAHPDCKWKYRLIWSGRTKTKKCSSDESESRLLAKIKMAFTERPPTGCDIQGSM
jgi:hypothetical protein